MSKQEAKKFKLAVIPNSEMETLCPAAPWSPEASIVGALSNTLQTLVELQKNSAQEAPVHTGPELEIIVMQPNLSLLS